MKSVEQYFSFEVAVLLKKKKIVKLHFYTKTIFFLPHCFLRSEEEK